MEIIPDDCPPTRKQEQFITKLVKNFPGTKNLLEYKGYAQYPTRTNTSSLITLALEKNWFQAQSLEGYAKYITTRPRAERLGGHGLFGDEGGAELDEAMLGLEHYTGNVWTYIISLHRKDVARLDYDNAQAWRMLLRTHHNDITAVMNIKPQDFRWYAAFHNEEERPHVHMMVWSANPGQAYLFRDGIRQIKSVLTNQISKQEILHLYEQKSESRDGLARETRRAMLELFRRTSGSACEHPEAGRMVLNLTQQPGEIKGKKSYGYLPKWTKRQVDEIINQVEHLPVVDRCYQKWWELQYKVDDYCSGRERQRPPFSEQKELRAIKNAVTQEAERVRLNHIFFEDRDMESYGDWMNERSLTQTCRKSRRLAEDEALPLEDWDGAAERLELLAKMGDPYTQTFLGQLYRDGGLLIPDAEKTRHWLKQATERELPQTQYMFGELLLSSDPDMCDSSEGIR